MISDNPTHIKLMEIYKLHDLVRESVVFERCTRCNKLFKFYEVIRDACN